MEYITDEEYSNLIKSLEPSKHRLRVTKSVMYIGGSWEVEKRYEGNDYVKILNIIKKEISKIKHIVSVNKEYVDKSYLDYKRLESIFIRCKKVCIVYEFESYKLYGY